MSIFTFKTTALLVHSNQMETTHATTDTTTTFSTLAKKRIRETVSTMNNINACFHVPHAKYNTTYLSLSNKKKYCHLLSMLILSSSITIINTNINTNS